MTERGDSTAGAGQQDGFAVLQGRLKSLPESPGVYRMLNDRGDVLYVGKARNLKARVTSYTRARGLSIRIARMVQMTAELEIITTHTEVDALLLEANLIKRLKPRFNIILRDDKTFPYIEVNLDHDYPMLVKHRGAREKDRDYYGPFASATAVNHTLTALQRAFPLRSCSDGDFATRTRPCLQYQIKRCLAPCVGYVSQEDYAELVGEARDFLSGRSQAVRDELGRKMQQAADALEFEDAAMYRNRLWALAQIQQKQGVNVEGLEEADVMAAAAAGGQTCVQVFFYRAGQNYGNRAYYPSHAKDDETADVLAAFVGQFYDSRPAPRQVLLSHEVENQELIAEALGVRAGRRVQLLTPKRGGKKELVDQAIRNAEEALGRKQAETQAQTKLLKGVAETFGLAAPPARIEVYDNSHIMGTNAVGGMIVAGSEGFRKAAYRKFNIKSTELTPGDDFAMMREVLTRRLQRLKKEHARRDGDWPDLLIIDGGKGQLGVAEAVLEELALKDEVAVVSIAKGVDRNAGREEFHVPGKTPFRLPERDPVLYYLQRLRDEAHRFAIGTHRARRSKQIGQSPLDEIEGIGPKRKKALLLKFGSAKGVARAGLADLERVDGISGAMAKQIYDHFNG
ncbi:excinuclease ABC subunit UvrC [Minwuia thermotolerans]|uniref:UvrABC system protein C n=1 Tax=Minwuia thermotolerans TaxID=2056226 RepID=A0A2M9G4D5_9PROT|nr:excinuclease ABC subunit UvrC [Minwuia thermotolerans]PJK30558.1 excinuclease ABC subunit C [Minwuia thermotolerans]